MSRTFQRLVTIGTALLVSLALALPAFADPAPPSGTNTNTTNQTAANTAYVTITAVAVSGDAIGKDDTKAQSGDANVFVANEQEQTNVQVVGSGVIGACGCQQDYGRDSHDQQTCGCPASAVNDATQTADNYAQAAIDVTANSGNATASEEECDDLAVTSVDGRDKHDETKAESGDATVKVISEQEQTNLQLALNLAIPTIEQKHDEHGKPGTVVASTEQKGSTAENKSTQTAANTAYANLTGSAWSGNAYAEGRHAEAESGEAELFIGNEQEQINAQAVVNLAFPWSSKNTSTQKAAGNYAQAGIDGTAWSGNAKAYDSKDIESGESEIALCNEQEQASLQLVLTVNGVKVRCY